MSPIGRKRTSVLTAPTWRSKKAAGLSLQRRPPQLICERAITFETVSSCRGRFKGLMGLSGVESSGAEKCNDCFPPLQLLALSGAVHLSAFGRLPRFSVISARFLGWSTQHGKRGTPQSGAPGLTDLPWHWFPGPRAMLEDWGGGQARGRDVRAGGAAGMSFWADSEQQAGRV